MVAQEEEASRHGAVQGMPDKEAYARAGALVDKMRQQRGAKQVWSQAQGPEGISKANAAMMRVRPSGGAGDAPKVHPALIPFLRRSNGQQGHARQNAFEGAPSPLHRHVHTKQMAPHLETHQRQDVQLLETMNCISDLLDVEAVPDAGL